MTERWQISRVSPCRKYHVLPDGPMYSFRYEEVLPFHSPGLAPAKKGGEWFHIRPDGMPVYHQRYTRTFGYYEERAAVQKENEWYHILIDGDSAYQRRFGWCGNFQNGICTVRDLNGYYHHILPNGKDAYPERYVYAGDFREGSAVVRLNNGMCMHINEKGIPLQERTFSDLDVFHKGFARACDENGWFHIDREGKQIYQKRFKEIEPFYNRQALCKDFTGRIVIIDETGSEMLEINNGLPLIKEKGPKILVIGTLGAGKTTFSKYISNRMGLPFTGIDDCRRRFGDGTFVGEYRAWTEFIKTCGMPGGTVLEFSGGGPHVFAVRGALLNSEMPIYVVWLDPPLNICIRRASARENDVPAPYEWGDVDHSTAQIYKEVERSWEREWTVSPNIHFLHLKMMNEKSLDEQFKIFMDFMSGDADAPIDNY
ncbi:MAG: hypothetical protein FIB08_03960 [Candidatus Methanoperedens sp.]|nr:hypothetical protein [Candidatus Methanoperedens sp.]